MRDQGVIRRRAQELFWAIRQAEADGVPSSALAAMHVKVATLHEQLAFVDLDGAGIGSWPDLFAAITHFAYAGENQCVRRLLDEGRRHHPPGSTRAMHEELDALEAWSSRVPPVDS